MKAPGEGADPVPRRVRSVIYHGAMKMTALALLSFFSLSAVAMAAAFQSAGQVRHVVVFKYRAGATDAQIRQVTTALAALKDRIPGIVSFEHGVNHSPENLNKGFTHVYFITFTDAKARDAYLPHPEHQAFGKLLGSLGVLEDVFVVDYTPVP
jgi:hypothetical protein